MQSTEASLVLLWHTLVESYAQLNLTFGSDKLPALSGLAHQTAKRRSQARYLAGLWSDSIVEDLVWYNADNILSRGPTSMPVSWQAPSWSWASTNASIGFPIPHYRDPSSNEVLETYLSLLHAETDLSTNDPTGPVKRGSITINRPTFEAEFIDTFVILSRETWWCRDDHSYLRFGLLVTKSGREIRQSYDNKGIEIRFDIPDNPFRNTANSIVIRGRIKCIRMARDYRKRGNDPYWTVQVEEYAMVIHQLTLTTYQRIGIVIQEWISNDQEDLQHPERVWEKHFSLFAERGVLETITIV